MKIGANYNGLNECEFVVWAPLVNFMQVKIDSPRPRQLKMKKDEKGYWRCVERDVPPGTRYNLLLDDKTLRPDPASSFQPYGVHDVSEVYDHSAFNWEDTDWKGIPLKDMITYEIHVGTFTNEGTFDAVIGRLDELIDLGINALEIMPAAQFPGKRNWGYDGVYPFAIQNSYGGPTGLKRLVNECHKKGIAFIIDIVYNHMGPEGNYFREFGPYFTDQYKSPWGDAINFDHEYSDEVRNFFIENANMWVCDYHVDALRLDAVDRIIDLSAKPFLMELEQAIHTNGKKMNKDVYMIAETALDDIKIVNDIEHGGYGIDAQWMDDFHHIIRTLLTGDLSGYYIDYGIFKQLQKCYKEGFIYSWEYSPMRKRLYGSSSKNIPADRFVVFAHNHDQIGNRLYGDRLSSNITFEALKLAAGSVFISPYIPLIFMGEEYAEDNPFIYFIDHSQEDLIDAIRKGRLDEFKHFEWAGYPPDPQSEESFNKSRLDWNKRYSGTNQAMLNYYKQLIKFKKEIPAINIKDKNNLEFFGGENDNILLMHRWTDYSEIICIANFNELSKEMEITPPAGKWNKIMDSYDDYWSGPGSNLPNTIENQCKIKLLSWQFSIYQKE